MVWTRGLELADGSGNIAVAIHQNMELMAARGNYVVSGSDVTANVTSNLTTSTSDVDIAAGETFNNGAVRTIGAVSRDLADAYDDLAAGQSLYVLIYVKSDGSVSNPNDGAGNEGVGSAATTGQQLPPDLPEDAVALAIVTLTFGDTTVDAPDIEDFIVEAPNGGYFANTVYQQVDNTGYWTGVSDDIGLVHSYRSGNRHWLLHSSVIPEFAIMDKDAISFGALADTGLRLWGYYAATGDREGVGISLDTTNKLAKFTRVANGSGTLYNWSMEGNFGFNTTDIEAWSTFDAIEASTSSLAFRSSGLGDQVYLVSNMYYDGDWKNKSAFHASFLELSRRTMTYRYSTDATINTSAAEVDGFVLDGGAGTLTIGASADTINSTFHSQEMTQSHGAPQFIQIETDASADNGRWDILANNEVWRFRVVNDANSVAVNAFQVNRTGTTVDSMDIATNLLPSADSTHDLGATATRWANGYFDVLDSLDYGIARQIPLFPNVRLTGAWAFNSTDDYISTGSGGTAYVYVDITQTLQSIVLAGSVTATSSTVALQFSDNGGAWTNESGSWVNTTGTFPMTLSGSITTQADRQYRILFTVTGGLDSGDLRGVQLNY